jgi:hypothetical protein
MKLRQVTSRLVQSALLLSVISIWPGSAFASEHDTTKGANCEPPNPNADFLTNFNKPCYALPLVSGNGLNYSGDSNATYDSVYYVVTPGYEIVLLGTYPNARFLSATIYDEHLAITSSILDQNIPPLNSTMTNPYLVGAVFQPNQQYGVTISFGYPLTATPSPGCSASDTTIDQTILNASQIHSGLTWLGYDGPIPLPTGPGPWNPGAPVGAPFPVHQTGDNSGGLLMVRKYLAIANNTPETVIVRDTTTGCALPASLAITKGILSTMTGLNSPLLNQAQISAHQEFSNDIEELLCYHADPNNAKQWFRTVDYVPLANLGAALDLNLTSSNMQPLLNGQQFIRLRFPAPTTPNIPCASGGCALTGLENLRYFSISFLGASTAYGKTTLTSVSDTALNHDPNGNVTLLVGLGAQAPSFVTPANYYTYFDLTQIPNYSSLTRIEIRQLLPNANFSCSNANVPLFTMEYNNAGGFMGQYVPTIDFPTPAALSSPAPPPPSRGNTCTALPGLAAFCGPSQ